MQGRNVRFQGKYDLFTIYLIPGVTIFLASFDSWTGTNLSVLGNRTGNKLLFAVWGFATGIYYCVYVRYLFHIGRYRNPGGRTLMYTAAAFLLMAVMIPYMPEKYPLKADLHVLLAFFSPVLLAFSIIGFLRFLSSWKQALSPVFWKYSSLQGCAGICAIWNSFWQRENSNVKRVGKTNSFPPFSGSKNKPYIWSVTQKGAVKNLLPRHSSSILTAVP